MMINHVYHLQRTNYREDIDKKELSYDLALNLIGTYDVTEKGRQLDRDSLLDEIWHCCNASCWYNNQDKFNEQDTIETDCIIFHCTNDFQGVVNSDIMVETNYGLYVAKPLTGWERVSSLGDGEIYIKSIHYKDKL